MNRAAPLPPTALHGNGGKLRWSLLKEYYTGTGLLVRGRGVIV